MSVARSFGRSVPIFSHDSGLLHSEVPAETILAEIQAKCQQSRLWQTSRPKVGQKSRFWLVGTTRNQTDFSRFFVLRFFSSHFCTSSLWGFSPRISARVHSRDLGTLRPVQSPFIWVLALLLCDVGSRNHTDFSLAQFWTLEIACFRTISDFYIPKCQQRRFWQKSRQNASRTDVHHFAAN